MTIEHLLTSHARDRPDAVAIIGEDGQCVSHADLALSLTNLQSILEPLGPDAAIAIVLPNGLEMAVAMLNTCAVGRCMPLNPNASLEDCLFTLTNAAARVLITEQVPRSIANQAASALQIPVLQMQRCQVTKGYRYSWVSNEPPQHRSVVSLPRIQPDDIALLLHTSGTTSKPKLVPLSHRNLLASATAIADVFELSEQDCCLNVMPLFHVHAFVTAVLGSLVSGGRVICARGYDSTTFFELLSSMAPSWYTAGPTIHHAVVNDAREHTLAAAPFEHSLRFIRSSAAALAQDTVERLKSLFGVPVLQAFSMTEAAGQITVMPLTTHAPKTGSSGIAAGPEVAISLQPIGELAPANTVGEIVVRGAAITTGYLNASKANAESFVNGWFRTGDQGYLDIDGHLFVTGREKDLINRGGLKISPHTIDEVIMGIDGVVEAATFGVPHPRLVEDVVTAVTLTKTSTLVGSDVRELLLAQLAPYNVPSQVIVVDTLPTGATGKLQRAKLQTQFADVLKTPYIEPQGELEQQVAEVFSTKLGISPIGSDDNFFRCGGDSLTGIRTVAALCRACNVDLTNETLFRYPTVQQIAKQIGTVLQANSLSATTASPERTLEASVPTPNYAANGVSQPTNLAQRGLWYLSQYCDGSPVHNVTKLLRLRGPLSTERLSLAIRRVAQRHSALRATFATADSLDIAAAESFIAPTTIVDLEPNVHLPTEQQLRERVQQEVRQETIRSGELLWRALLIRVNDQDHALVLTFHHSIVDAWSVELVLQELAAHYSASPGVAVMLREDGQHDEFIARQGAAADSPAHRSYWLQQLQDAPPLTELPTDRPRPAQRSFLGAQTSYRLSADLLARLKALARTQESSLYCVLLTSLNLLLHRLSSSDDLLIGMPYSNRNQHNQNNVGMFVNTLVLRSRLNAQLDFTTLLHNLSAQVTNAVEHGEYPFETLLETLNITRSTAFAPLVQIVFTLQNESNNTTLEFSGLQNQVAHPTTGTSKFDLTLIAREEANGLMLNLEYATDLYRENTLQRWLQHLERMLECIAEMPAIPIENLYARTLSRTSASTYATADSRRSVLKPEPVHRYIELFANQTPAAVALSQGDLQVSYAELNRQANRLARALSGLANANGGPIGLKLERSPDLVHVMLACSKAGLPYMALDPAYPDSTIERMVHSADCGLIISLNGNEGKPAENHAPSSVALAELQQLARLSADDNLDNEIVPTDVACIYFTSGSTGEPKVVQVRHESIVSLVRTTNYVAVQPSDAFLFASSPSFDAANFEVWGALLNGARCEVSPARSLALNEMEQLYQTAGITIGWLTSALFNLIVDRRPAILAGVNQLFVGGEAVSAAHAYRAYAQLPRLRISNCYGPTECTTFATHYVIPRAQAETARSIPIGLPINGANVYVLNNSHTLALEGELGQIVIGGIGVCALSTAGAALRPAIPDPDGSGEPLYATGDLGRYLPDGNIDFVGRRDEQVKVRGFRIELAEIRMVLKEHPATMDAEVFCVPDANNSQRTVSVVTTANVDGFANELRRFLQQRVPSHMMPDEMIVTDELPRTVNGKLDRAKLQALQSVAESAVAPSPTESWLIETWNRLLAKSDINQHSDFFYAGGSSIDALRLIEEIDRDFGFELPLPTLLKSPIVEQLAKILDSDLRQSWSPLVPLRKEGTRLPLFLVHPLGGNVLGVATIGKHIDVDRPVYALQAHGVTSDHEALDSIEDMAGAYLAAIQQVQPTGPYYLCGISMGGLIAYEMAQQLVRTGEQVGLLAIGDTFFKRGPHYSALRHVLSFVHELPHFGAVALQRLFATEAKRRNTLPDNRATVIKTSAIQKLHEQHKKAIRRYRPARYDGDALYIQCAHLTSRLRRWERTFRSNKRGWDQLVQGNLTMSVVPGSHNSIVQNPVAKIVAAELDWQMGDTDRLSIPAPALAPQEFKFLGLLGTVGTVGDYRPQLVSSERTHIAAAGEKRQREYAAGRCFARAALHSLGIAPGTIGTHKSGAPQWPASTVGSISHTGDLAVAIAGFNERFMSVGIDIEHRNQVNETLYPQLLTAAERVLIESQQSLDDCPGDLPTLLFSAKEAIYKALHPVLNSFIDYTDVNVRVEFSSGRFYANFVESNTAADLLSAGRGYYTETGGHYLCLFVLRSLKT